jgi:selenide,water dikinase
MQRNLDFAGCLVDGLEAIASGDVALLFDPQTSGGLLLAVPPAGLECMVKSLASQNIDARVIGRFTDATDHPRISIA